MEKKKANKKYILSIDIDYILEPFLAYVEESWSDTPFYVTHSSKDLLDEPALIFKKHHALAPLLEKVGSISQKNFSEVLSVFSSAIFNLKKSEHTKVYFGDSHDTILTPIEQLWNSFSKQEKNDTKFTLINMDHHHDIYYSERQREEVDKYNLVSPGDWVWYLDKSGVCEEYHWIGNKNSTDFKDLAGCGPPEMVKKGTRSNSLEEFLERKAMPKKFDLIYVCKSPQWTPAMFYGYFDMLKKLAEDYFGKEFEQDIGFYCGGRVSRRWGSKPSKQTEEDTPHINTIEETRGVMDMLGGVSNNTEDDI